MRANPCWILLFLAASCSSVQAVLAGDLDNVREMACSQPRLLSSLEFAATTDIEGVGIDKMKIHLKGNRFLAETEFVRPPGIEIPPKQSAYDGNRYQVLDRITDGKGLFLSLSDSAILPTSSSSLDALTMPYEWLFPAGESCDWAGVKNDLLWKERFSEAKYVGRRQEDRHEFEIVELPGSIPDTITAVYFAVDLGYYPLKAISRMKNGDFCKSGEVVEYKEVRIGDDMAVVPLAFEFTQQNMAADEGKESSIHGICRILEESLKVNCPIDEDLFTISPTRAREVIDLDRRRADLVSMKQRAARDIATPMTQPRLGLIMITVGLVVLCAAVLLARKYFLA